MDSSPYDLEWDIRRSGHSWGEVEGELVDEILEERWQRAPEKVEMIEAKLFVTDEQRLLALGLLLENLGVDAAVRFGDPEIWREAMDALEGSQ